MYDKTRIALLAFIDVYRRHTGKRLTADALIGNPHELRHALEDAIGRGIPDLYRVTEGLVLALRKQPLLQAA